VARELKAAGWRLERCLCDNGNELKGLLFHAAVERLGARVTHIHAGRPQTNGHVEALHKTILEECWRPAFARYLYPASEDCGASSSVTSPSTDESQVLDATSGGWDSSG